MGIDFQAQRIKMVDGQLRTTDVTDRALLAAFLEIPREIFLPENKRDLAYLDSEIEVAPGRVLISPSPFAKLASLASITASDTVLIIGCATGYGAAVLAKIAARVVALDSDGALAAKTAENAAALGLANIAAQTGNLEAGHPQSGPYDVIILCGAVGSLPETLLAQLKDGGRLVAIEGSGHLGAARLYVRRGAGVSSSFGFNASVSPLPGFAKSVEFVL